MKPTTNTTPNAGPARSPQRSNQPRSPIAAKVGRAADGNGLKQPAQGETAARGACWVESVRLPASAAACACLAVLAVVAAPALSSSHWRPSPVDFEVAPGAKTALKPGKR